MQTKPRPFVFVMMPFRPEFDDVFALGIQSACEAEGAFCQRLDQQVFSESMLQRIFHQIDKADFLIADLSDQNANVFYETGYAHALGKRVILLTQSAEDIPFDLKHFVHVVYSRSKLTDLRERLAKHVRWHLDNPLRPEPTSTERLQFFLNGTELTEDALVTVGGSEYALSLSAYNATERLVVAEETYLNLLLGAGLSIRLEARIETPEGDLVDLGSMGALAAGAWRHLGRIPISKAQHYGDTPPEYVGSLRLSSPFELRRASFRIAFA